MELSKTQKIKVLVRAGEIIALPASWTTNVFARSAEGNPVSVDSPKAVSFCVRGAISKALLEAGHPQWRPNQYPEYDISRQIQKIFEVDDAGGWNNTNNHAGVLDGLKKVVEVLKAT